MEKAVTIRALRRSDTSQVAALMRALGRHHGDKLASTADDFLRHCFGPAPLSRCFVAVCGSKCVGFILGYDWFNYGRRVTVRHVDLLYVDSGARRGGVGRKLLAAMTEDARQSGVKRLTIGADPGNPLAQAFYGGLGLKAQNKSGLRYVVEGETLTISARSQLKRS